MNKLFFLILLFCSSISLSCQDAETILEKRKHVSDRDFINAIKKMFNI